uniref:Uncharacterized protein n=1 Tax=Anguilla anguilla TaxID=7936 RepID=A0A0E9XY32_ANGAN
MFLFYTCRTLHIFFFSNSLAWLCSLGRLLLQLNFP